MPQKILWDEDEALILLDALLQVLSGALSRKNAAALVSRELRTRAIYEGHAMILSVMTFKMAAAVEFFLAWATVSRCPDR